MHKTWKVAVSSVAVLTWLCSGTALGTVFVVVNPGVYPGAWHIPGVIGSSFGSATVSLAPGNYQVTIGQPGSLGGFVFTVDSGGRVSVPNGVGRLA